MNGAEWGSFRLENAHGIQINGTLLTPDSFSPDAIKRDQIHYPMILGSGTGIPDEPFLRGLCYGCLPITIRGFGEKPNLVLGVQMAKFPYKLLGPGPGQQDTSYFFSVRFVPVVGTIDEVRFNDPRIPIVPVEINPLNFAVEIKHIHLEVYFVPEELQDLPQLRPSRGFIEEVVIPKDACYLD